jgi:hypothetical protein
MRGEEGGRDERERERGKGEEFKKRGKGGVSEGKKEGGEVEVKGQVSVSVRGERVRGVCLVVLVGHFICPVVIWV